jgi:hypothetical protein
LPARLILVVDGEGNLEGDFVAIRTEPPRVYVTTLPIAPEEWSAIAAIPGLRDCCSEGELYDFIDPYDFACFYTYNNNDYGAPGAYERKSTPERPMHLDELPPPLRDEFSRVRLPVKFAEKESIQLADYMGDDDTAIWGDVTLRGEDRAVAPPTPREKPALLAGSVTLIAAVLFLVLALVARC